MFEPRSVHATIPVRDLEQAKGWYAEKLGLEPHREDVDGAWYRVGDRDLLMYPSGFAGTNQATTAEFVVESVPPAVAALRERGVVFEEYDFPQLSTVEGIATYEGRQAAWFKDLDGNILALTDMAGV